MKDHHSNMRAVLAITPALHAADVTSSAIDRNGYVAAEIVMAIANGGITFDATNKIEIKVTHSDDDSVYTAVEAADVLGVSTVGAGGILKALVAAHTANSYRFGYRGSKRYLKVQADFSGTHGTGTGLAVVVLLLDPHVGPVANQA